jgi:hypothetical protein
VRRFGTGRRAACAAESPGRAAASRHDWLDVGVAIDKTELDLVPEAVTALKGVPELGSAGGGTGLAIRLASGRMLITLRDPTRPTTTQPFIADDTLFVGGAMSEAIRIDGKRYRGGAKVFLNRAGRSRARTASRSRTTCAACCRTSSAGSSLRRWKPARPGVAARTYTLSYVGGATRRGSTSTTRSRTRSTAAP